MKTQLHHIRAYRLKELAGLYGVSSKTMKRWIKRHEAEIGNAVGHFYLYHQVKKIVDIHGPFALIV